MDAADPAAIRILVVEDEVRLATFIRNALRELSFDVDIAADGPAGLQRGRSTHYDLVILDVMPPGLDGFAVCRELRRYDVDVPIRSAMVSPPPISRSSAMPIATPESETASLAKSGTVRVAFTEPVASLLRRSTPRRS